MPTTVLSVASKAVLDACSELGLDRVALAEAAGLELAQLEDPDARISATEADAVWAAAVAATRDPCLAIQAAAALPFGAYRVIDFLVANAPTLGEGLERVARYFPLIDPRGVLRCVPLDDEIALEFSLDSGHPVPRPAAEYTLTAVLTRSRASTRIDWTPRAIEFTGARAEPQAEALERLFGVVPRYGARMDRLRVAAADWTRENVNADRSLFEVLERHAAMLLAALPAPQTTLARDIRAAVAEELRGGNPTLARIGKRLGVSGRTLQRRLDDENLRFGELVDEVKAGAAKAYLHDPGIGIGEVAFLLGFADQSAFTRAFKRWTGDTPGRYRRAL